MQRAAYAFLFLLLCLMPGGCREDSPVLPAHSLAGQLKKKVLVARDNPNLIIGETEYAYGPDQKLQKAESYFFPEQPAGHE
jgi:hypothetical protein